MRSTLSIHLSARYDEGDLQCDHSALANSLRRRGARQPAASRNRIRLLGALAQPTASRNRTTQTSEAAATFGRGERGVSSLQVTSRLRCGGIATLGRGKRGVYSRQVSAHRKLRNVASVPRDPPAAA
jgi:hypothetical protein